MGLIDMLFGTDWTDELHNWPKGSDGKYVTAAGETKVFPSPRHAVDNLESTFEAIYSLVETKREAGQLAGEQAANFKSALDEYVASLQVLTFAHRDIALRKGTFGRLIELVEEHVKKAPELLEHDRIDVYLRNLHETLLGSDEEEFKRLAAEIKKRMKLLSGE